MLGLERAVLSTMLRLERATLATMVENAGQC